MKNVCRKLQLLVVSLRGDHFQKSLELGLEELDENVIKHFDGV